MLADELEFSSVWVACKVDTYSPRCHDDFEIPTENDGVSMIAGAR